MLNKNPVLSKVSTMREIATKYDDVADLFKDRLDVIEKSIQNYQSKIVLVGRFSAGKSALLNNLIGQSVLEENQGPETAIATELYYGDKVCVKLVNAKMESIECEVGSFKNVEIDKFMFAKMYIDSAYLRQHSDVVLVDMPGLDSTLERHNKAISQYIEQACAYMLVVDVDDGTLTEDLLRFVKEVNSYDSNLVIVITKCDKKMNSDVIAVRETIQDIADESFDGKVPVVTTDKFDVATRDKIDSLLEAIDYQILFEHSYSESIRKEANDMKLSLELIKDSCGLNNSDINKKKEEHDEIIENLQVQLERQKFQLHEQYFNHSMKKVLTDAEDTLENNVEMLLQASLAGGESFQKNVCDLLRPVLHNSTKQQVDEGFKAFLQQFSYELGKESDGKAMAKKTKIYFEKIQDALKPYGEVKNGGVLIDDKKKARWREIMGTLAVFTDTLAPWMEIVIIALPDIINFVGKYFRQWKIDEYRVELQAKIIPEIIRNLEPRVEEAFKEIEKQSLENMQKEFDNQKSREDSIFAKLLEKDQSEREQIGIKISAIEKDIEVLNSI